MKLRFYECITIVVFHRVHRRTTVNKNGHNYRYAH